MKKFNQVKAIIVGLVLSSSVIPAAMADDIEIYTTNDATASGVFPNILFLVDNSISMGYDLLAPIREHYDPGTTYTVVCQTDGIYFTALSQPAPDCSTAPENYFNRSALVCDTAR